MEQRTCPVCRTEHQRRGIYCSRKCCRRVSNARARGTEVRQPIVSFDCEWCGKQCAPGQDGIAAHASRFCGYDCKAAWHKLNVERVGYPDPTNSPTPVDIAAYRRAMRSDPCAYCGAPSTDLDHIEPKELGGSDDWTNRAGACSSCNQSKWLMPMLLFLGYRSTQQAHAPWKTASAQLRREHLERVA